MKKIILSMIILLLFAIVFFGVHAFNNRILSAGKVKAVETFRINDLIKKGKVVPAKRKAIQSVGYNQPQKIQHSQPKNTIKAVKVAEIKHTTTTATAATKVAPTHASAQSQPKSRPKPQPKPQLLIDKIKGKENAQQAIVVTTNGFGSVNSVITTFEKINGIWRQVASFAGDIGRNGFAYNKIEGDGHSPIGIFSLGTAFGRYSNPGTALNYRQSTTNDFWVDDSTSSLYNTWQVGPANKRWNSAENMYIPPYNYGFVINYNTTKKIPGKGSAIFFHVWSGSGHGTAGCTATSQTNVISILRWLKPSKNAVIIEGPMSEVIKM